MVHVLVNSAAVTRAVKHDDLEALDDELFDRVMSTNVRGPFATVRAFRALLKASGDAVIETAATSRRPQATAANPAQSEALSALGNLGYAPGDAAGAVAQALGNAPDLDTGGLIRAALKLLAPKG